MSTDSDILYQLNQAIEKGGIQNLSAEMQAQVFRRLSDTGMEGLTNIGASGLAYSGTAAFYDRVLADQKADSAGVDLGDGAVWASAAAVAEAAEKEIANKDSKGFDLFDGAGLAAGAAVGELFGGHESSADYQMAMDEAFWSALGGDDSGFEKLDSWAASGFDLFGGDSFDFGFDFGAPDFGFNDMSWDSFDLGFGDMGWDSFDLGLGEWGQSELGLDSAALGSDGPNELAGFKVDPWSDPGTSSTPWEGAESTPLSLASADAAPSTEAPAPAIGVGDFGAKLGDFRQAQSEPSADAEAAPSAPKLAA